MLQIWRTSEKELFDNAQPRVKSPEYGPQTMCEHHVHVCAFKANDELIVTDESRFLLPTASPTEQCHYTVVKIGLKKQIFKLCSSWNNDPIDENFILDHRDLLFSRGSRMTARNLSAGVFPATMVLPRVVCFPQHAHKRVNYCVWHFLRECGGFVPTNKSYPLQYRFPVCYTHSSLIEYIHAQ